MIRIDHEFESLIPPLTAEEYAGLQESIIRDGCIDPLVLWGDTLVDGHNRYRICEEHGIAYDTVQMDFGTRDDALRWIITNQFSRRNLPAYERARLALRLKPVIAAQAEKRMRSGKADLTQISAGGETRDTIARTAGVSHDTIAKVEKIEAKAAPEIKQKLSSGEMSINQAYKAVKLEEKKAQILQAERSIHEQAGEELKPVLYIGDSVGHIYQEQYDLLLTDPPYSTDMDDIWGFAHEWLYPALAGVKATGSAYVFIGAYPQDLGAYLDVITPKHLELTQVLVWTYKNTLGQNPKDRYKQNWQACLYYRGKDAPELDCPLTSEQWAVQEINAPDGRQGDRYHAWQKPMELAERFIRHSTKPGDLVYDPFACTGTFLLAATKLGRRAFGYEINPENAQIAFDRGCVHG